MLFSQSKSDYSLAKNLSSDSAAAVTGGVSSTSTTTTGAVVVIQNNMLNNNHYNNNNNIGATNANFINSNNNKNRNTSNNNNNSSLYENTKTSFTTKNTNKSFGLFNLTPTSTLLIPNANCAYNNNNNNNTSGNSPLYSSSYLSTSISTNSPGSSASSPSSGSFPVNNQPSYINPNNSNNNNNNIALYQQKLRKINKLKGSNNLIIPITLSPSAYSSVSSSASTCSSAINNNGEAIRPKIINSHSSSSIAAGLNTANIYRPTEIFIESECPTNRSKIYLSEANKTPNDRSYIKKIEIKYPADVGDFRSQSTRIGGPHQHQHQQQHQFLVNNSVRSSSFKFNNVTTPGGHINHQPAVEKSQQLNDLSLLYLKKNISNSKSFQNKINLYSNNLDDIDLLAPLNNHTASAIDTVFANNNNNNNTNDLSARQSNSGAVNCTVKRAMSTNVNSANINKFIKPKIALNASSTSINYYVDSTLSANLNKPPPIPGSKSSTSKF